MQLFNILKPVQDHSFLLHSDGVVFIHDHCGSGDCETWNSEGAFLSDLKPSFLYNGNITYCVHLDAYKVYLNWIILQSLACSLLSVVIKIVQLF